MLIITSYLINKMWPFKDRYCTYIHQIMIHYTHRLLTRVCKSISAFVLMCSLCPFLTLSLYQSPNSTPIVCSTTKDIGRLPYHRKRLHSSLNGPSNDAVGEQGVVHASWVVSSDASRLRRVPADERWNSFRRRQHHAKSSAGRYQFTMLLGVLLPKRNTFSKHQMAVSSHCAQRGHKVDDVCWLPSRRCWAEMHSVDFSLWRHRSLDRRYIDIAGSRCRVQGRSWSLFSEAPD